MLDISATAQTVSIPLYREERRGEKAFLVWVFIESTNHASKLLTFCKIATVRGKKQPILHGRKISPMAGLLHKPAGGTANLLCKKSKVKAGKVHLSFPENREGTGEVASPCWAGLLLKIQEGLVHQEGRGSWRWHGEQWVCWSLQVTFCQADSKTKLTQYTQSNTRNWEV